MKNNNDQTTSDFFSFHALQPAKVSEISEATASSPVSSEERVNFHIGNPVQDVRLIQLYFSLATKLNLSLEQIKSEEFITNIDEAGWDVQNKTWLEIIYRSIENIVPYAPRGGYSRQNPGPLTAHYKDWLTVSVR